MNQGATYVLGDYGGMQAIFSRRSHIEVLGNEQRSMAAVDDATGGMMFGVQLRSVEELEWAR